MAQIVLGKTAEGKSLWAQLKVLLRTRLLIQANSGGGKSWLLRLLAELLFGKVQVIIIDREGEFANLRPKFGYLLVGQVSEGADLQADVRSARLLAEKVLELGVSTICDLYEAFRTNPSGRRAWVAAFLEGLIDAPKALWHDCIIIVDEAHQFCPESLPKAASMVDREIISRCKEAMVALATVGRKRGFCAVWATQRLAKLDKDASAELFNRLVGMTIEDVDVDRSVDLMSVTREDKPAFRKAVRELEPGNFFAFGQAITKERLLFKVAPVTTTHQEPGSKGYTGKPPPVPQVIKALLPQLADLAKQSEAKAKTEAELRLLVKKLEAQLQAALKKPAAPTQAPKVVTNTVTKVETKTVEIPVLQASEMKKVHAAIVHLEKAIHKLDPILEAETNLRSYMDDLGGKLSDAVEAAENFRKPPVKTMTVLVPKPPALPPTALKSLVVKKPVAIPTVAASDEESVLSRPQQEILRALREYGQIDMDVVSRHQIAGWLGKKVSGSFMNDLGKLRTLGHVNYQGKGVMLTASGLAESPEVEELPSPEGLFKNVLGSVNRPQQDILKAVYERNPDWISRVDLASSIGKQVSGSFMNDLGSLRTSGILVYGQDEWKGHVKCADWMFISASVSV